MDAAIPPNLPGRSKGQPDAEILMAGLEFKDLFLVLLLGLVQGAITPHPGRARLSFSAPCAGAINERSRIKVPSPERAGYGLPAIERSPTRARPGATFSTTFPSCTTGVPATST